MNIAFIAFPIWFPCPSPAVIKSNLKTARSMLFAGPDHCRITTPALRVQAFPGSMSVKSVAGKRRLHVFKTNRLIND